MIKRLALGSSHGRGFLGGPHGFRPALQQKQIFAEWQVAGDGPLNILRAAVVAFDSLRNVDQRVEFIVIQACGVLLFGRDLFVDDARA